MLEPRAQCPVVSSSGAMPVIKYIVSIDGFYLKNTFHPKELSILDIANWDDLSIFTERYLVPENIELDDKSRKHIGYVKRFVHGLDYTNSSSDRPHEEFVATLRLMIANAVADNVLIAHKGGPHTRALLDRLGATNIAINLDYIGCPKFEKIYQQHSRYINSYLPCANHRWIVNPRMCTRMKLIAYRIWLVTMSLVPTPLTKNILS